MDMDLADPRSFFDRLVHPHNDRTRPGRETYRKGEIVLEAGGDVTRMLIVRFGEVEGWLDGARTCAYIADPPRHGALPILSACDYFLGRPSEMRYVAATPVEIIPLTTPMVHRMARDNSSLPLIRNLALFSDIGAALRKRIAQHYAWTGIPIFQPAEQPGLDLLRNPCKKNEDSREYYERLLLDFAETALAELTAGRIYRSRTPSTAITPLMRTEAMEASRDIVPSNQGDSE